MFKNFLIKNYNAKTSEITMQASRRFYLVQRVTPYQIIGSKVVKIQKEIYKKLFKNLFIKKHDTTKRHHVSRLISSSSKAKVTLSLSCC